eukprot:3496119-Amphidinium_carterae.1
MRLNDIILPPVSPTATAGEGAQHEGDVGAGVGSMEPIQELLHAMTLAALGLSSIALATLSALFMGCHEVIT